MFTPPVSNWFMLMVLLQRLCEELEYSELVDRACQSDDPYERMVCFAAYSINGTRYGLAIDMYPISKS